MRLSPILFLFGHLSSGLCCVQFGAIVTNLDTAGHWALQASLWDNEPTSASPQCNFVGTVTSSTVALKCGGSYSAVFNWLNGGSVAYAYTGFSGTFGTTFEELPNGGLFQAEVWGC